MNTFKFISYIFIWTLLMTVACSTTIIKEYHNYKTSADTIYSTSTRQLKSDKIPDSVFQMTDLTQLSINGEDCDTRTFDKNGNNITQCWMIKEIPPEIKNLKNLKSLSLTLNAISIVPNELAELKNLKLIDFTDNAGLSNIDNITKIKSLQYLYLYGCGLTKLPGNISDLTNLKELALTGNHLEKEEQKRIKKLLPNCVIKF